MGHYDKDRRYMAARDLGDVIGNNESLCPERLQSQVIAAFVKQLEDHVIEVQGNAASILSRLVCRMHEDSMCM